jgi:phosphate transport system protein
MAALFGGDIDLAKDVIAMDHRLRAIHTIARRQPVAVDLREIVGAIRIAADLERIGDLAKILAKRATKVSGEISVRRSAVDLSSLHEQASAQLKDVLNAYARRDILLAREVWERDARIDAVEDAVSRDLLTFMMEDPRTINFCTQLLFCSKNLERVGDHTTNIAETVTYIVTGETLPVDRPRGVDTASAA